MIFPTAMRISNIRNVSTGISRSFEVPLFITMAFSSSASMKSKSDTICLKLLSINISDVSSVSDNIPIYMRISFLTPSKET